MMISEYTIFCVGCNSVVDKEKAERIFRTGFYKASMRLGFCTDCGSMNSQLEEANIIEKDIHTDPYIEGHVMH